MVSLSRINKSRKVSFMIREFPILVKFESLNGFFNTTRQLPINLSLHAIQSAKYKLSSKIQNYFFLFSNLTVELKNVSVDSNGLSSRIKKNCHKKHRKKSTSNN